MLNSGMYIRYIGMIHKRNGYMNSTFLANNSLR